MSKPLYRSNVPYVSQQAGWRFVFVALLLSAILGLSFRLYLSPKRLKAWIESELRRQPAKIQLKFASAELSLAQGSIPQLAIRLTGVEGRSEKSCVPSPGFQISEIYIPFQVFALIQGRVAVGTVHGESLRVDLDALRNRCPETHPETLSEAAKTVAADVAEAPSPEAKKGSPSSQTKAVKTSAAPSTSNEIKEGVRPWWTPEQLQTIHNLVAGLAFEHVELRFEKGAKSVELADVLLRSNSASAALSLSTDVRIPPGTLYGQNLPPFSLEATVRPDSADVEARGNLSEGSLMALATLKAVPDDLSIEAHLSATSVPLSALVTVARKAGWSTTASLQPKFMWMNCEASIAGGFRRLFKENPLVLERCSLEGDSGRFGFEKAVIGPEDKLKPFTVKIENVDVQKAFDSFRLPGPNGIMKKFGRVNGEIRVLTPKELTFEGRLVDSSFRFSRRNIRAEQAVREIYATGGLKDGRLTAAIEKAELVDGRFDGRMEIELESGFEHGRFQIDVRALQLQKDVQRLMLGGEAEDLAIKGKAELHKGRIAVFKGDVAMKSLQGENIRVRDASLKAEYEEGRTRFEAKVPQGFVRSGSRLMTAVQPLFLGHEMSEDWIPLKNLKGRFALEKRDIAWESASVELQSGGVIKIGSQGRLTDAGGLAGSTTVDFPKLKNLRWDFGGTGSSPVFTPHERTRVELERQTVTDSVLGLTSSPLRPKATTATSASPALKGIGQTVLEKAKSILPKISPNVSRPSSEGHEVKSTSR